MGEHKKVNPLRSARGTMVRQHQAQRNVEGFAPCADTILFDKSRRPFCINSGMQIFVIGNNFEVPGLQIIDEGVALA